MDSAKPGRRRTHEPEWEESNHAKRKRKRDVELDTSDSVQIVGETHTNNLDLKQLDGHLRGTHGMESTRRLLPNGACAGAELHGQRVPTANGARGKDRVMNGVHRSDTHSASTPTLPPSLRESERMLFVQQWINTIPPDLPLWVQTSLTKIVPITNPEYYPEEDDHPSNSDCLGCEGSISADHTRLSPHGASRHILNANNRVVGSAPTGVHNPLSSQSLGPYHGKSPTANALTMLGPRHPNNNHSNNAPGTTAAATAATATVVRSGGPVPPNSNAVLHSSSSSFHPGQPQSPNGHHTHRHPGTAKVDHVSSQVPGYTSYPVNNHAHPPTGLPSLTTVENGKASMDRNRSAPVGRLFDDMETEMVVKLFRDYFTKGSCPILNEVRKRTANTPLDGRRTAISIRAKIKRLQTSGRWTNYTGI